jgi:hypothetical protein
MSDFSEDLRKLAETFFSLSPYAREEFIRRLADADAAEWLAAFTQAHHELINSEKK